MPKKIKQIVCLGGGNAMPKAVLRGLKNYSRVKISAICAMLDSGGSSGRLRREYNIFSLGDIRRALIALSNSSPTLVNLLNYRFQKGSLKSHNFGNFLILALYLTTNNFEKTIEEIKKILNIKHPVLPVTLDQSNLYAILENGKIISGEANIDVPKHNGNLKIKKVYLRPKAKIYPEAERVIKKADLIVLGPGDLYSSLSQILLVEGVSRAIRESGAKKVYICNLMTKYGETNNFTVLDFVNEIERYLEGSLDFVIYNTKTPASRRLIEYRKKQPQFLKIVKVNKNLSPPKFIGKNLIYDKGPIEHDPKKLSKVLLSLV